MTEKSDKIIRTIEISEADFELIQEALYDFEKECKTNADRCMSGYRSVASENKREAYLVKANACFNLVSKLAEYFIH